MNTTTRSYESSGWETASTATSERFNSGGSVKDMAPTSAHRGGRRERDAVQGGIPRHIVGMNIAREERDYPRHRSVAPQDLKYMGQDPRVPRDMPSRHSRDPRLADERDHLYGEKFLLGDREESTTETASLTCASFVPPTDTPHRGHSLDMSSISGTGRDRSGDYHRRTGDYDDHEDLHPYHEQDRRYIPDESHRSAPAGNGRYSHHPEDRYYHHGPPHSRRGPPPPPRHFRGPPPYHPHDAYHPEDHPYYPHEGPPPSRRPPYGHEMDRSYRSEMDERDYGVRRGPRGYHPRYHPHGYDDYDRRPVYHEEDPYDSYPRGPPRGGHPSRGGPRMPSRSISRGDDFHGGPRLPPRTISRDDSHYSIHRSSPSQQQHTTTTTSPDSVVMVDISPGVQARLRRIHETLDAVAKDYYTAVGCLACQRELFCIADVEYFLCPDCKVISPLEEPDSGCTPHGLGMGFTADTLMAMQSEVFAKKHAARQQQQQNGSY